MLTASARWSLLFSCIGHFYIHLFTAFYFVIVLTLEVEWNMPYHELIELWTLGALLVGLAALPAGRLGDKWTAPVLMVIFFIGMGLASIVCGFLSGPTAMMVGLAGIGLFAAIYHPVGIPWLIRNCGGGIGKVLAVNGIFGNLGAAAAALVAGVLIDAFGWRSAFIVPGVICVATGGTMLWFMATGRITSEDVVQRGGGGASRGDMLRVFSLLMLAMFVGGVIYNTMQGALPKLFAERLQDIVGEGATGVGAMVAAVFAVSGFMQIIGGHLADRHSLRLIYVVCWFFQVVFLMLIGVTAGLGLVGFAALAVMINVASHPAENMMLARYTPRQHHGIAFGMKFVLSFTAAPVAIELIAGVREATGDFIWLFIGLGVATLIMSLLLLALPAERAAPSPAPAE